MGRPQGIKVCQFQMHSGFFPEEETLIHLEKSELDDLPDAEHIPMNFSVSLPIAVSATERMPATALPWLNQKKTRNPMALFGSILEYEENVDNFSKFVAISVRFKIGTYILDNNAVTKPSTNPVPARPVQPPPRPVPPPPQQHQTGHQAERSSTNGTNDAIPNPIAGNVDLVNIGATTESINLKKEVSFDLLGGFESSGAFEKPLPDILSKNGHAGKLRKYNVCVLKQTR